ncbi:hypothetical protein QYF36_009297 [Acer negundo]|nr:hypothetical protein QYF36_009297 [Acer negundo]
MLLVEQQTGEIVQASQTPEKSYSSSFEHINLGQLAELLQEREKGKFPSQSEQARAKIILKSGRVLKDNIMKTATEKDEVVHGEEESEKELEKKDEIQLPDQELRP